MNSGFCSFACFKLGTKEYEYVTIKKCFSLCPSGRKSDTFTIVRDTSTPFTSLFIKSVKQSPDQTAADCIKKVLITQIVSQDVLCTCEMRKKLNLKSEHTSFAKKHFTLFT